MFNIGRPSHHPRRRGAEIVLLGLVGFALLVAALIAVLQMCRSGRKRNRCWRQFGATPRNAALSKVPSC
jgi:hypothetical protein